MDGRIEGEGEQEAYVVCINIISSGVMIEDALVEKGRVAIKMAAFFGGPNVRIDGACLVCPF